MMICHRIFLLILTLLISFNSSIAFSQNHLSNQLLPSCSIDSKMQEARSKELSQLVAQDQKEREHFNTHMTINEINNETKNDLIRRVRVGEIMAEGCLKTASDYAAASLIYQHGDVPDHYYQAFIWANRAIELGDIKQKELAAMTIDRYLISIGKKQIFGSQFYGKNVTHGGCFCLQPVERSFPDSLRMEYLGKKLADQYGYLLILNNKKMHCSAVECPTKLSSTPKGTILGFW
jgi:hypothetical protein